MKQKKKNKTNIQNMFKIQTFFIEHIEMIKFVNKFEKVIDDRKTQKLVTSKDLHHRPVQ